MDVLHMVLTMAIVTAGGALGAGGIAWLFWTAFKFVHRPQWGPVLAFVFVLVLSYPWLRTNECAQTLLLFSALTAAVGLVSPSDSAGGEKRSNGGHRFGEGALSDRA